MFMENRIRLILFVLKLSKQKTLLLRIEKYGGDRGGDRLPGGSDLPCLPLPALLG